jgi:glutathione S-transferase
MWLLHQFPLCPFSRKVRLLLGEKGVGYEPWERRDEFIDLNPAGSTPVIVSTDGKTKLMNSSAICEYFEETVDKARMISGTASDRAEIRRLAAWFDETFYASVTGPLLHERMLKRVAHRMSPDTAALREAMKAANAMLDYVDYLIDTRPWLGGPALSLADLAGAAHISVADYLGGIDWRAHTQTHTWYMGMKSRPSFRPLLSERMAGVAPPPDYDKVDF